jgi:mono/diheme cytochrome c family protein
VVLLAGVVESVAAARTPATTPTARMIPPAKQAARLPLPPTPVDSQAELGRRWFASACEGCHAVDDVSSDDFKAKWSGRRAYDLFDQIARTMPEQTPGSLPRRAYVDIVAYLMKQNGAAVSLPLADDDAALSATVLQFNLLPRS